MYHGTIKILKLGHQKSPCNFPKNRTVWFNNAVMHPKDADGMANSVDPDQTAPQGAV